MENPLSPFEQLWDEVSVRQEIEEFFGEFDPLRWGLGGGMNKPFKEHLALGKDAVEFYRDEIGYVYQSGWNQVTHDERTKYIAIRDYALAHGYKTAIDWGCGNGSGVITLALAGLDKVVAADVCKPNLDFVKARAKRFGLDTVKFFDAYPDKSTRHKADLVICTEVFEHVADPVALAHSVFKMINPGGAMIASWSFVDMVGHLPEHFHLAARHPDQWQTEGMGLILIEEVGFVFDKWTWFNNTAWLKGEAPPQQPTPELVVELAAEVVEEVTEPVAEEVHAEEFGSALGVELDEEPAEELTELEMESVMLVEVEEESAVGATSDDLDPDLKPDGVVTVDTNPEEEVEIAVTVESKEDETEITVTVVSDDESESEEIVEKSEIVVEDAGGVLTYDDDSIEDSEEFEE